MKVSVSIVTFNHERFIAQAIEGVLMQETPFEVELIVGDDVSTDRTREIVLDYQRRHPERIRTVLPASNLGDGGKRLFAATLAACRGEHVAMLDGDDYWTAPDKLAKQAAFLDAHPDCAMCFHDVETVDAEGRPGPFRPYGGAPFLGLEDVVRRCVVPSCSPMFRAPVLAELPGWYWKAPWGDWPLYILAARQGRIGYLPEVMGAYRVHGGGLWSSQGEVAQQTALLGFYGLLEEVLGPGVRVMTRREAARCRQRLACALEREGEDVAARGHAWRALLGDPFARGLPYRRLLRILARPSVAGLRRRLGAAPSR